MPQIAIGNLYRDTEDRLMMRAVTVPPGVGLGRPYRSGNRLYARIAGDSGVLKAFPYRDTENRLKWRMGGEPVCTYSTDCGPTPVILSRTYTAVVTAAAAGGYQGTYSLELHSTQGATATTCLRVIYRGQEGGRTIWLIGVLPIVPVSARIEWHLYLGGSLIDFAVSGYAEWHRALPYGNGTRLSPLNLWWIRSDEFSYTHPTANVFNAPAPPGRVYVSGTDGCAAQRCLPNILAITFQGLGGIWGALNGTNRMVAVTEFGGLVYTTRGFPVGVADSVGALLRHLPCNSATRWIAYAIRGGTFTGATLGNSASTAIWCDNASWPEGTYNLACGFIDPINAGSSAVVDGADLPGP